MPPDLHPRDVRTPEEDCQQARNGDAPSPATNRSDYRGRVTAPALYRRLHVDLARTDASLCRRTQAPF